MVFVESMFYDKSRLKMPASDLFPSPVGSFATYCRSITRFTLCWNSLNLYTSPVVKANIMQVRDRYQNPNQGNLECLSVTCFKTFRIVWFEYRL